MKTLKYGSIVVAALLAASIGFMSCGNSGGTLASITVSPSSPTIARGTKHQFTALATFSNGTMLDWTTAADWTSDNSAVTISNSFGSYGLATSETTTGMFTITATDTANHISGTATLTVVDPISITITPNAPFMAKNTTHQFKATATLALATGSTPTITQDLTTFATWTTGDAAKATISSTGFVTAGTSTGTVTITATDLASSISGTTTLTITDTSLASILITSSTTTITVGSPPLQFTATGNYPTGTPTTQDFTNSVIWHSSNTSFATIDNAGLATAVAVGTTTITATDPITGKANSTTLKVQ